MLSRQKCSGLLKEMQILVFIAPENENHNSVISYLFVGLEWVGRRGQGSGLLWRTSKDTRVSKVPHSRADSGVIVLWRRLAEAALGPEGFNWDSYGNSRRALRVRSSAGVNPYGPVDLCRVGQTGTAGGFHMLPFGASSQPAKRDNYVENELFQGVGRKLCSKGLKNHFNSGQPEREIPLRGLCPAQ